MPWTVYQKAMPSGMATAGADAKYCACHRKTENTATALMWMALSRPSLLPEDIHQIKFVGRQRIS
jgi:hypothetical protein